MANDSPFPACDGKDCATLPHEHAQKDIVASAGESSKQTRSRKLWVEKQAITSDSPFPFDNSKD